MTSLGFFAVYSLAQAQAKFRGCIAGRAVRDLRIARAAQVAGDVDGPRLVAMVVTSGRYAAVCPAVYAIFVKYAMDLDAEEGAGYRVVAR